MSQGLYTLFGVVLGLAGAPLTEMIRHRLARAQESEDRRTAFQRESLIELQNLLGEYVQSTSSVYTWAQVLSPVGQLWGSREEARTAASHVVEIKPRISVLASRISDDEIRTRVKDVVDASSSIFGVLGDTKHGDTLLPDPPANLDSIFGLANERIGVVLRDLL